MKKSSFLQFFLSAIIASVSLKAAPMRGFLEEGSSSSPQEESRSVSEQQVVERVASYNSRQSSSSRENINSVQEGQSSTDETMMEVFGNSSSLALGKRDREVNTSLSEEGVGKRARNEMSSIQEQQELNQFKETAMVVASEELPSVEGAIIPTLKQLALEVVKRLHRFDKTFFNTRNVKEVIHTEHLIPWLFQIKEVLERLKKLKESSLSSTFTMNDFLINIHMEKLKMQISCAIEFYKKSNYPALFQNISLSKAVLPDVEKEISLLERNKKTRQQAAELRSQNKEFLADWREMRATFLKEAFLAAEKVVAAKTYAAYAKEYQGPGYFYSTHQVETAEKELQCWILLEQDGERYEKVMAALDPPMIESGKELLDQYKIIIEERLEVLRKVPGGVCLTADDEMYRADEEAAANDLKTFEDFLREHSEFHPLGHYIQTMNLTMKAIYAIRVGRWNNLSYYSQAADTHRELANILIEEHVEIRSRKPLLIEVYKELIRIDASVMETLNKRDDLQILINNNREADGTLNETGMLYGVVFDDFNKVLELKDEAMEEFLHGKRILSHELMRIANTVQALAKNEQERATMLKRLLSGITRADFLRATAAERQEIAHLESSAKFLDIPANIDQEIASLEWNFNQILKENLAELIKKKARSE